ncbi:MAG: hypothetical protein M3N91_13185 [Pseudomonadota bacterium]|nr:hypothetical protein [Pseudomonadota bacterium]
MTQVNDAHSIARVHGGVLARDHMMIPDLCPGIAGRLLIKSWSCHRTFAPGSATHAAVKLH